MEVHMAWKESSVMDERAKFVLRVNNGERMSDLCREFGISRKTGYKIYNRFKNEGIIGLYDKKRGPKNPHNEVPNVLKELILSTKSRYKSWGAKKIRHYLLEKFPGQKIPVNSTIHNILDLHGLVKKKKRRPRHKAVPTNLSNPMRPNDLWCIDYKGQFKTKDHKYCYPLTITDQVSRYLIKCEGHERISTEQAIRDCRNAFEEFGMPKAIRSDNGAPFSARTIWGLSELSLYWLRLGIKIERIRPGHPQENGRHERMHRTLKLETVRPPKNNILQQQEAFDEFKETYNNTRPHEALEMKRPSDLYLKSKRNFLGLPNIDYTDCEMSLRVTNCGSICINGTRVFISCSFRDQELGLNEEDDGVYSLYFMNYQLGFIDLESKRLSVQDSPFGILT